MNSSATSILIVDDDTISLDVLGGYLRSFGVEPVSASGGLEALECLTTQKFDLIISDLRMPEMDGIALLEEVRRRALSTPFIVVTACGSIESAVDAIRQGAYDYIEKPFQPEKLRLTVNRALEYERALSENRQIKEYFQERFTFQNIITATPAMKAVLEMAEKVSSSPYTTVAIYGESGTGKELLARAIHYSSTGMPTRFVAVNCAAIPEHLMESELFGHVKGAYTGADSDRTGKFSLARNGTLLLDEIGEMPLSLQGKLLRVLQERLFEKIGSSEPIPLSCRVIAATNTDLAERVESGAFRYDLLHRINVFPLNIPPLRERTDDIVQICEHILDDLRQHLGKSLPGISQNALNAISAYSWPGNVRELRNCLERAAILTNGDLIRPEHLGFIKTPSRTITVQYPDPASTTYHLRVPNESLSLTALNREILSHTLDNCKGNKTRAAQLLKIDRKMFYRL